MKSKKPQLSPDLLRAFGNVGKQKSLKDLLLIARFTLKSIQEGGSTDVKYFTYNPDITRLLGSSKSNVVWEGQEHGLRNWAILIRYQGVLFIHASEENWWKDLLATRKDSGLD